MFTESWYMFNIKNHIMIYLYHHVQWWIYTVKFWMCAAFGKIWQNCMLVPLEVGTPTSGKSWICHWFCRYLHWSFQKHYITEPLHWHTFSHFHSILIYIPVKIIFSKEACNCSYSWLKVAPYLISRLWPTLCKKCYYRTALKHAISGHIRYTSLSHLLSLQVRLAKFILS